MKDVRVPNTLLIIYIISLTIISITGIIYLCIKTKSEQKENMTKEICNTIEKLGMLFNKDE